MYYCFSGGSLRYLLNSTNFFSPDILGIFLQLFGRVCRDIFFIVFYFTRAFILGPEKNFWTKNFILKHFYKKSF